MKAILILNGITVVLFGLLVAALLEILTPLKGMANFPFAGPFMFLGVLEVLVGVWGNV